MNKLAASLIGSLLAGMLAIGGCGSGDDASSSNAAAPAFNSAGTPVTTGGTGTSPTGQVVLVRLGTDNLIQPDPPKFRKIWVAIVTDTAGRAVPGVTVTFALRSGTIANPGGYEKGQFVLPGAPTTPPAAPVPQVWTKSGGTSCPNEDINFNAILDPGEDANGNGLLEPPGVSDVNPTGVSDASGFATATISYPQNYASWASVTLEASTGGSGAVPATATFFLVGLASDYSNLAIDPPGKISPFGKSALCTDTL